MAQHLTNLIERRTLSEHLGGETVAEDVGAFPWGVYARVLNRATHDHRDDGWIGERGMRWREPHKHVPAVGARSFSKMRCHCATYVGGQRQSCPTAALSRPDGEPRCRPVDVFQLQRADFSRAEAEPSEQQKNRVIPTADHGRAIAGREHLLHGVSGQVLRQIGHSPVGDGRNSRREIKRRVRAVMQESEERPQRVDQLQRVATAVLASVTMNEVGHVTGSQPRAVNPTGTKLLAQEALGVACVVIDGQANQAALLHKELSIGVSERLGGGAWWRRCWWRHSRGAQLRQQPHQHLTASGFSLGHIQVLARPRFADSLVVVAKFKARAFDPASEPHQQTSVVADRGRTKTQGGVLTDVTFDVRTQRAATQRLEVSRWNEFGIHRPSIGDDGWRARQRPDYAASPQPCSRGDRSRDAAYPGVRHNSRHAACGMTGKTFAMAAAAMELKRLGLARKPMFVVPNHMLGQFSSELLALYPGANILAAGRDDFASFRRRELMSRIATNNWDAIIVTHSGFERLPLSIEARKEFLDGQLAELAECILEHKNRIGASSSGSRIVKELERAKKKLEGRIKSLGAEHRKDDTLTFEELGVDRLFVDEAQAFKNLFYISKMTRVAGLPQTASERAFDMFLKIQHVQKLNNGGGVVFATGTPVTNTMAEMFTMQRYLQMDMLRRQNLQHFDAWAGTFGETVTAMELAPDGAGYRLHTRFARFVNVPELMQMFRSVADVQTAEMLKLPIPALDGGKARIVRAPATPELKTFVASLAQRAEKLKREKVDPSVDNMLKITGEGRKAALDLRLVQGSAGDVLDGKVNQAVREIFSIWQETRADRLTQMVFCDLSTPKVEGRGFSVYQDIKAKLIARGVPVEEIAFIQEHDGDAAKLTLFKDVRAGKVRVLLGSTQKMGAGTNAQTRLVALHHLDAPWRPADIEQREGRILRQGNQNAVVRVNRYVTEGSFDAYMWQTLETKAKFIAQVMTGRTVARRIEDLDSPALTYAEVKAIASGNPLVIEKAKVDAEVMRLARLRSEHSESQYGTRSRLRMAGEDAARLERQVAAMEQDAATRVDTHGEKFRMLVGRKTYTERTEAGAALVYLAAEHRDDHLAGRSGTVVLGELAGFKIEYRSTWPDKVTLRGAAEYSANISPSPIGSISSLEHAVRSIDEQATRCREELARCRQAVADLTALTGKVFEHEERYRELLKRQGELVDLLDITKNQAAAQQAAESTGDVESLAAVPEPGAPSEDESPEETPAASVSVHPAVPETPGIRPIKSRRPVKMESPQPLAPTVRLASSNPGRMRIAI
jgi:hypothetical protein